jgi:hypothetical protein
MMDQYQRFIYEELKQWETEQRKDGFLERWSRGLQKKMDNLIPQVIHDKLAVAVETTVKSVAHGVSLIPQQVQYFDSTIPFINRDKKAQEVINRYKRVAVVQGAGTGAGGFLLSAVDFPALIGIKFKLLQELANIYGYNIKHLEERMFIIKIFQLAFVGDVSRKKVYEELKSWPFRKEEISQSAFEDIMAWREFYTEYRESIEFRKLLQFIPGFGAIVGAWANRSIVDDVAVAAINVYRLRYLQESQVI